MEEDDIVKILAEYGLASTELAGKIAIEIGMLYTERTNFIEKDYLEKSLEYLNDYVKTFVRDSPDRLQLSHLISEIEEYLRKN